MTWIFDSFLETPCALTSCHVVIRHATDQRRLWRACKGMQALAPAWLLEEDMGRKSPLSEYISLHLSLTLHRNINPFKNKVWEIHFDKEVRSFDYVSAYIGICMSIYNIWVFGAEGQFMPTWHDFEPEFKLRRSRKWLIKRRETKRKSETERRIQHIKKIRNEKLKWIWKKEKKSKNEIERTWRKMKR